jgi:Nif-specific regulatory protein
MIRLIDHKKDQNGAPKMAYSLVLLNGPTPGAAVPLDPAGGPVTIGRDNARELPIDDHLCSRLHARVRCEGQQWLIEDCGSRNGTMLNGQPIQSNLLEPGDVIRVGDRLIVFVDETDLPASAGLRPSKLAASTFVVRVGEPDRRDAIVERLREESDSRPARDVASLCRLATQLHEVPTVAALMRLMIDALTEATGAERVAAYLLGSDARLRCAGRAGGESSSRDDPHVLASLALTNNEAILLNEGDFKPDASERQNTSASGSSGTSMGVPIPCRSARRGAVECHRDGSRGSFSRSDFDMAIAIVYQVGLALENLEHREQLELANEQLRQTIVGQRQIVGQGPAMQGLLEQVARAAPTAATVLVVGDSGTGKELVAQSIHDLSPRRAGPCVAVNCAAFNESLLESELFGHERGAFTGADRRRIGQFERAHRGTLFLDEVGEMSLACQAKLLRVLEGHPFERLGGTEPIRVDVRIVAATHRDLAELVKESRFREDLFYRLRVIELRVPPLRERGDDRLALAAFFLDHFRRQVGHGPARLSAAAASAITSYAWPGNVRELKNAIERAVVLGRGDEVEPADLGLPVVPTQNASGPSLISLEEAERRHIRFVLDQVGGNKTRACEILGIGRGTRYTKLESR